VPVGTPVFTAGFPRPLIQGLENKVTFGEINSHSGMMDNKDHYQCSVPVQPGNSGGALTARGWVVGVVFSKLAAAPPGEAPPENVSYAIKPSVMRAFIESVPEAKPLLEPASRPKPDTVERDQAIKRAQDCAVLILVK
jgi:serine protease Do